MAKKKHKPDNQLKKLIITKIIAHPGSMAFIGYTLIALILTFPLILKMNSSVYGFYDHISTDMFATIYYYFWSIQHALLTLKTSPLVTSLFTAPFGARINFVNFTGFVLFPISALFGHLFCRNLVILFNLVVSGLGMFYLVRHITKNPSAGFIAGIIYAFCPNMMVRSYTTFDSTQVQWIPFYTLYILKCIERCTWKHAFLAGIFLACNILFAMPYYLIYLPVHTMCILLVYACWHMWGKKRGFAGLVRDITTREAFLSWMRIAVVLGIVLIVFALYYKVVVGGSEYTSSPDSARTTEQLGELALKPSDYLMPHPRSALLKGTIKESYWNAKRPGKDPDSFVAYIGYIALVLAALGCVKGQRGVFKWLFLVCGLVAFWSTLGPQLFGIHTPSGLIHKMYAPFARRILLYKVFVQLSIAGLAGMGTAYIFEKVRRQNWHSIMLVLLTVFMISEYTLVPPPLSVDLTHNPEIYERIKALPEDTMLMEVPLRRNNHNLFQGYLYYQMFHKKRLFNPYTTLSMVPENIRPFYRQMEVPLEAQEYAHLAALRYLGVTHLTYHWYIGTQTVRFGSFAAPGFAHITDQRLVRGTIDGLQSVYTCNQTPFKGTYQSPYDYTFADLYEITAEPCPVALTFDYQSPYEQVPGVISRDVPMIYGWVSALLDTSNTFFYPLTKEEHVIRLLRQGGRITAINLSDEEVRFSLSFIGESADSNRVMEAKWNDGPVIGRFTLGTDPLRCRIRHLRLGRGEKGILTIWSTRKSFLWDVDIGDKIIQLPVSAVLYDFRAALEQ